LLRPRSIAFSPAAPPAWVESSTAHGHAGVPGHRYKRASSRLHQRRLSCPQAPSHATLPFSASASRVSVASAQRNTGGHAPPAHSRARSAPACAAYAASPRPPGVPRHHGDAQHLHVRRLQEHEHGHLVRAARPRPILIDQHQPLLPRQKARANHQRQRKKKFSFIVGICGTPAPIPPASAGRFMNSFYFRTGSARDQSERQPSLPREGAKIAQGKSAERRTPGNAFQLKNAPPVGRGSNRTVKPNRYHAIAPPSSAPTPIFSTGSVPGCGQPSAYWEKAKGFLRTRFPIQRSWLGFAGGGGRVSGGD